ncbi:UDP-N-acetylglucosamine 2-epimerase (non-hydrolyzing) [Candidatus Sumerlaeota bacterium]|nr:UDP-N-acetylglucosamine 2-epimerase (non-hydrolyzing) [Candidatus Sumerlaeota bacterium]
MRVLLVFGTRPEAIKMAPVYREMRKRSDQFECKVCATAQHREMLDSVLDLFTIRPDYDLDIMAPSQSLERVAAEVFQRLPEVLSAEKPDCVLVQGDTTSAMAAALCAYYQRIAVGHVEAGLRSGNVYSPFPEEINRRVVSHVAQYHFAPTERARQNLMHEGIAADRVVVTGNTVIDALLEAAAKARQIAAPPAAAAARLAWGEKRVVLITGHRRESFGEPLRRVCSAFRQLSRRNPDVEFFYPVHLNPEVREPVRAMLSGIDNFHLVEPLDYLSFVWCMDRCYLIITDSGGIQEEGPSLGKPVLVTRDVTERSEGIEAGTAKLVGADAERIIGETQSLLDSRDKYEAMSRAVNPYGDGHAAERIADFLATQAIRK